MPVRCSVLGHDLTTDEREVESDTTENVTIVKTVETCTRCDYEETIRENKQVSLAEAEAEFHDDLGPNAPDPADVDHTPTDTPAIADGGQDRSPAAEDDEDGHHIPEDDAMILSDDTSDASDETHSSDTSSQQGRDHTAPSTTDAPDDATSEDEDAMLLDDDASGDDDYDPFDDLEPEWEQTDDTPLEESTTLNPDGTTETDRDDADSDFSPGAFNGTVPDDSTTEIESDSEILSAGDDAVTTPETSSHSTGTSDASPQRDVDPDLTCDTCRFGVKKEGTPLRIGDICPSCRQGYIESTQ